MVYRFLMDTVIVTHLLFIVFVLMGGVLVLRYRAVALLHIPSVLWAVILEFRGLVCPLTPIENLLRKKAGMAGYSVGFIEHYLTPVIYPGGLSGRVRFWLGIFVLAVNLLVYLSVAAGFRKTYPPR